MSQDIKTIADDLGYQDGKERCGAYTIDEEMYVVDIIMDYRNVAEADRKVFLEAYCAGYKRGASGDLMFDPKERAKEKQRSRDQDEADLASGKITREELRRKNGAFVFPNVSINFTKVEKY